MVDVINRTKHDGSFKVYDINRLKDFTLSAAILDAILKMTLFRKSDCTRFLVCYLACLKVPKTIEKPFVSNFLGFGGFFFIYWPVYTSWRNRYLEKTIFLFFSDFSFFLFFFIYNFLIEFSKKSYVNKVHIFFFGWVYFVTCQRACSGV